MEIKLGDKFWAFDENRRVYDKASPEHPYPTHEGHFYRLEVIEQTSRSWVMGWENHRHFNVPKNDPFYERSQKYAQSIFTDEQKAGAIWIRHHRQKILELVRQCSSADTMKAVAALVDYAH